MSKYNSKKVEYEWIKFDSKVEMEYYIYLLSKYGIRDIKIHPSYILEDKFVSNDGEKIQAIKYIADFEVTDQWWFVWVIDIKWLATPLAKLKRKLFLCKHKDKSLSWIVKYKGERVDYFDNEKRKSHNKKTKHEKVNI